MYAYQTPGVYFEWQDKAAGDLAVLRTDIAGFVGLCERGPLHQAVKTQSWTQFVSIFGEHSAQGYLAYAVEGFFRNGGRRAWVVRAANPQEAERATLVLRDDEGEDSLCIQARSPGVWAHRLLVTVLRTSIERFALLLRLEGGAQEIWSDLSLRKDDARYAPSVLNDTGSGSLFVRLVDKAPSVRFPRNVTPSAKADNLQLGSARLQGGSDGLEPKPAENGEPELVGLIPGHLTGEGASADPCWGLDCLRQIDEIGIVAIPDIMPKRHDQPAYQPPLVNCKQIDAGVLPVPASGSAPPPLTFAPDFSREQIRAMQQQMIAHCEGLKDRFAVLDLPQTEFEPQAAVAWRKQFDSSYAALYYPWIIAPDPLGLDGIVRALPPSGHLAGIYARGDLRVGVHQPPANQALESSVSVNAPSDERLHGYFNQHNINVIRTYSGRGLRVSGARTLSADPSLRYINVRRLLMMIAEVIEERAQALVFEQNNPRLWRNIERVVGAFLDQIWRAGMLDGARAADAYYVRCDSETNAPQEQAVGRVLALVGVQPPWPAEFVVLRIGFTESGVGVLEEGR